MQCKQSKQLLLLQRESLLADAQKAELEQHLAGCASCRAYRQALEARWQEAAPEIPVPPGFLFAVRKRLREAEVENESLVRRWRRKLMPVLQPVAIVALLLGVALIGRWLSYNRQTLSEEQQIQQILESAYPVDILAVDSEDTLVGAYLSLLEQ